jgi:hypothetical protein
MTAEFAGTLPADIRDAVRARVAEATLAAVREARDRDRERVREDADRLRDQIQRLQRVIDAQQEELAELRERLRQTEAELRQVGVQALVASVVAAVQDGAQALECRTVAAARFELRAPLRVGRAGNGLVLAAPGTYDAASLSTVSLDVRPLPPSPAEEEERRALARLLASALALQHLLERRPFPPAAEQPAAVAFVQLSALVALPPTAARLRQRLAPVAEALATLAGQAQVPQAVQAAVLLRRRAAALPDRPEVAGIDAVTAALAQLLEAFTPP